MFISYLDNMSIVMDTGQLYNINWSCTHIGSLKVMELWTPAWVTYLDWVYIMTGHVHLYIL